MDESTDGGGEKSLSKEEDKEDNELESEGCGEGEVEVFFFLVVFQLVFTCGNALDLLNAVRREGCDKPEGAIFTKPLDLDGRVLPAFRDIAFRDVAFGDGRGSETFAVGLTDREAVALGCSDFQGLVE